jgi:hypothetical protein
MKRFPDAIYQLLSHSGWYEGRDVLDKVRIPEGFELFPAAEKVLREFGNLHIGACGPGKDWATIDVELDPLLGEGYEEDLAECEERLGVKLYPLGEGCNGHEEIIIDEQGRVFEWQLFDELAPCATSFDRALEVLLLGLKREKF